MDLIDDKNAQFMLLAGFIIALGLVITTVMLSTIIFEGNIALDVSSFVSKNEMVNLIEITEDEVRSGYRSAEKLGGSTENETANFTKEMRNFSKNLAKIYAFHGEAVNVSMDIEKWRNERFANFTESGLPGGNKNWTLVEGVNPASVDKFEFEKIDVLPGKSFIIEARNSTGYPVWSVELNSSLGYEMINTSGTSSGSYLPDEVELLDTEYYFKDSLSEPVSIHILNGNNAYGKLEIRGIANNRAFYRERHYVLNATLIYSASRVRVNTTIPVSVPW